MIYFLDVHGRGSWADCFLKAPCSVQSHLGQGHARASRPGRGTFNTHARGPSTQTCGETADTGAVHASSRINSHEREIRLVHQVVNSCPDCLLKALPDGLLRQLARAAAGSRPRARSLEIARDRSRTPKTARDRPRSLEIVRDHSRSPESRRPSAPSSASPRGASPSRAWRLCHSRSSRRSTAATRETTCSGSSRRRREGARWPPRSLTPSSTRVAAAATGAHPPRCSDSRELTPLLYMYVSSIDRLSRLSVCQHFHNSQLVGNKYGETTKLRHLSSSLHFARAVLRLVPVHRSVTR